MAAGSGNVDLDKQRIRTALVQHIVSLCRVGLSYNIELSVEGLLGITLDKTDVFLINIKEVISQELDKTSSKSPTLEHRGTSNDQHSPDSNKAKRRRKRKHSSDSQSSSNSAIHSPVGVTDHDDIKSEPEDNGGEAQHWSDNAENSGDSGNCIVVKEEPGYVSAEYGAMRAEYGVSLSEMELSPLDANQQGPGDVDFSSMSLLQPQSMQRRTASTSSVVPHPVQLMAASRLGHPPSTAVSNTASSSSSSTGQPARRWSGGGTSEKPEQLEFKCATCNKGFKIRSSLQRHTRIHTGNTYVCEQCGKEFQDKYRMDDHVRTQHDHEPVGKCSVCQKVFFSEEGLRRHQRSHTGTFRYRCPICRWGFQERHHFKAHMCRKHGYTKEFKCKACKKEFATKNEMEAHYTRIHNKPPVSILKALPVACKICHKVFNQKKYLTQHMRGHSDEKKYQCESCGKGYKWASGFKKHTELCGIKTTKEATE